MQRSHNKHLINPDIKYRQRNYHNPSSGISVFYAIPVHMWSCEMGTMSPVSSFCMLLRMTIYYNCLIMSLKWVLFSSLNTSGKAFQLTMTFMTSTSLYSIDAEADCKLDSAMYLVPYFFTHWLVWYSWQQPTLLLSACNFVAISKHCVQSPKVFCRNAVKLFRCMCIFIL